MTFPGTDLLGVPEGECEARVEGHATLMRGDDAIAVLGAEVGACGSRSESAAHGGADVHGPVNRAELAAEQCREHADHHADVGRGPGGGQHGDDWVAGGDANRHVGVTGDRINEFTLRNDGGLESGRGAAPALAVLDHLGCCCVCICW